MTLTRLREYTEFVSLLVRELQEEVSAGRVDAGDIPRYAMTLCNLATRIQRLNESACNRGLTDREERQADILRDRVAQVCRDLAIDCIINSDPRGATIRLKLPSGITNDFIGSGYCVPLLD